MSDHNDTKVTTQHSADTDSVHAASRFPEGIFTPRPRRASARTMILAQARIESLLFLRHGEQQLVSIVIPVAVLIALTQLTIVDIPDPLVTALPMTLAIAIMSAGYTGQAIAVAFDRRYGALKRIGASGVPSWTIIVGKIIGVLAVNAVQIIILCALALFLGWRTTPLGILYAAITLVFGVATFTGAGLFMGGTLSSELVLACANLIWFVLVGTVGFALLRPDIAWLDILPSVALARGFVLAFTGHFPLLDVIILALWAAILGLGAHRFFTFSS